MAFVPPEQQSAAAAMQHYTHHKSPKPGKIDRHAARQARRTAPKHRLLVWQARQLLRTLRALRWQKKSAVPADALRLRLSQLLKRITQSIGLSAAARCGSATGGGSTAGSSFSGTDPPAFGVRRLDAAFKSCTLGMQSLRSILKRCEPTALQTTPFHISRFKLHVSKPILLAGIAALANYAVPNSYGSVISDVSFGQGGDGTTTDSKIYLDLQNNDSGVIYERGE
jgi:hypothetical protein